ncbi:hypothetical protein BC830DRAFT_381254 [Chytriomyces sp. MP71]|nr:hypothetical protein BC830DRAFT_381254 [Chytriomyces sp. MP71]
MDMHLHRTPKKTSAVHYTSAHSGLAHSSSSSKLDSTPVNTPSTLSEENLKFHTRLTRNQPMSFVERISIWRQSLPDKYEDEEELRESIRRSSSARNQTTNSTITTSQSSPSYPTNTPHSKPASPSKSTRAMPDPARSSGRPTTVGGGAVPTRTGTATAGTYYSAAAVKKRYEEKGAHSAGSGSLFRPLPSLATLGGVPYAAEHEALELHGQQQRLGKKAGSGVHAEASIAAGGGVGNGAAGGVGASSSTAAIGGVASPTSRGKLLCCLKVEIKTGVFRMLPVHENDDAHELSLEFCKTNHLMNSVEALTNHVSLSKSTFTK